MRVNKQILQFLISQLETLSPPPWIGFLQESIVVQIKETTIQAGKKAFWARQPKTTTDVNQIQLVHWYGQGIRGQLSTPLMQVWLPS